MYLNRKTEIEWIATDDIKKLPPYELEVLVVRPNPVTGEDDIKLGRLKPAEQDGILYGKAGSERRTFDDYWLIQRSVKLHVMRLDRITYFAYKPTPPKRIIDRYK